MPETKHPLQEYREANSLSRRDMGAKIGVSDVQVWRIEKGERLPSMALARKIFEVTEGKVDPNDWLPREPAPEPDRIAS